jgi:ApaLI-like restriction endonuclease
VNIEVEIRTRAKKYAIQLQQKIDARVLEMQQDDLTHHLIYRVLGIGVSEGQKIDEYQNTGRFLYNAAGRFLEEVTKLCFKMAFSESGKQIIPNTRGLRPKTFEIDCLVATEAIEIKWRDATTDGDHINKEHTRLRVIADKGFTPIRVMFYYPNRRQAIQIQETLQTLYRGVGGEYYFGDAAWEFVRKRTGIDLKTILENIANETSL